MRTPTVATLGNFDGIHLGHRKLLTELQRVKANGHPTSRSIVLSFYPHPAQIVRQAAPIPQIKSLRQELADLQELGFDQLIMMRFTNQLAALSAAEFVRTILLGALKVEHLVIGPDAHVGAGREGDCTFIRHQLEQAGRKVTVVPFLEQSGEKIGSRAIRDLIAAGNVERVPPLLGHPYRMQGRVIKGAGRGRTIGIPTANLQLLNQVLPRFGVYATRLHIDQRALPSVTNVGLRPTFGTQATAVETHILDYASGSLYGQRVEVEFVARIRDERKFESPAELAAQIRADIEAARVHL